SCDVWGITFDKEGNLYYAERHPCNVIKKMDVNGNISDYAYVSGDPVALAFDQQGNLYASCYNSKNVIKIPAGGGTYYSYAWGFTDPYGLDGLIAIGDTLYLCEYSTQRIYKILPGGGSVTSSNVIAIQPRIYGVTGNSCRITGIDVLPDGNLIVATLFDYGLYKVNIKTGSSVKLVDVPSFGCGRIVHTDDGYYYFTGYYSNKVYKMHIDSLVVRDFAGSTQGYFDGPALAAMFYNPAGLAISDEGYFIVGDANNRKLRKISPCKNIKFDAIADYGCMGKPVTLHASITDTAAVASYKWTRYNNSLFTNKKDTSFILTYDGLGVYSFVVTDEYGCNLSKSVYINNPTSNSELNINLCGQSSFTSPSGKYVWTQSGIYYDTLVNHLGCDSVIYINLKLAKIDTSITIDGQQIISNESRNYVEYLWLECDNNYKGIKGAYNRTFIPSKTGSYAVMLYYEGCYDTSRCVYVEVIENNVNHPLSKHDWSVYPTTNQGIFTIECPADSKFDIFDYTGRIVLAIKHKGGKRTYHTNLQKGIYFIKDVSGNRKPFIVQ
ncbi:MAG: T9SS type A sorting domain-containing protein, partial [Bacteroidales bacterium]|nr:T9SS type A sorting domain-containing protein [Bacteroidales bacterium]